MKAFTLIEIVIVVLIIGIITGMVMVLSGEQLRKLQWETVKQSILTEYQSRYSRNLTSSFFANERYEEMQISFKVGKNWMGFAYLTGGSAYQTGVIRGDFVIEKIFTTPENFASPGAVEQVQWVLKPYEISCTLESVENGDDIHNVIVLVDVKQQKKYCFSLYDRTCRMTVLPDEKCEIYAWVLADL